MLYPRILSLKSGYPGLSDNILFKANYISILLQILLLTAIK